MTRIEYNRLRDIAKMFLNKYFVRGARYDRYVYEEILSNVMIQVCKHHQNIKYPKAYIKKAVLNKIYDHQIVLKRLKSRIDYDCDLSKYRVFDKSHKLMDYNTLLKKIIDIYNRKPDTSIKLFLIKFLTGCSEKDLVNRFKLPIGTVKSKLFRGAAKLRNNEEFRNIVASFDSGFETRSKQK
jgi:DNA-directed RNA polymerase specialized sigma24 family protein